VSIVALLLYADLRLAYYLFYRDFHVTPEQIGLGYVPILAESAVVTVLLLVLIYLAILILCVVGLSFASVSRRPRPPLKIPEGLSQKILTGIP